MSERLDYMAKPCPHCPFRRDVRPFLRVERAEEIAYLSGNRYSDFPCHRTTVSVEDDEGWSDRVATSKSLTCAGFLAMAINYGGRVEPKGWEWPGNVYRKPGEMVEAYQMEADGEWTP